METLLIVSGCTLMIVFVLYQAVRGAKSRTTSADLLPDQEYLQTVDHLGAPVTATGTGTLAEQIGPGVNTNGMPMINDALDVAGHAYGDSRID